MRKSLFLSAIVFLSLLPACIKSDDDDKCGESKNFDFYKLGSQIFSDKGNTFNSYMEGSNRVFQWGDAVENVCPWEHVKVDCRVAINSPTSAVSARGRIDWNFFFEQKIEMLRSGVQFSGNGEAGLKQAFGEGKAWFIPVVEVFFPTKGSYSADSAFLATEVISVELKATYKAFKQ